ncbi:NAD(+) kinase [Fervidobacterium thailandense]|uniref:NAD kinase n=1 Tax=Fervidobacterium thailandense TaxID=1008305 RepID=A0A1E3G3Z6_9BACT|nr:NAD(+) kinase [Fervidobacterium thailandense]ODN31001.1 NAD(+) kinase [Fervidobacterium thailandense]
MHRNGEGTNRSLGISYRRDYEREALIVYEVLKVEFDVVFFVESSQPFDNLPPADAVIVVGGDGTVLRTLKKVQLPVIGVKAGRLGFFSSYHVNELEKLVLDLHAWRFKEDKRWLLKVEHDGLALYALNDAVLQKDVDQKIVDFHVRMQDGTFDYHADGLVISTPTGSSAYALALGGPIMLPNVEAFEITPMAPQFLATRSLVIPSSENVIVDASAPVNLVVDGDLIAKVSSISVSKSDRKIVLLRPIEYDFSSSIKEKIGYGRRVLNGY